MQVLLPAGFGSPIISGVTITNPPIPAEHVPYEVAALCRDRPGAQPDLA